MRLSYKLSLGVGIALGVALGIDSYIAVERSVSEYEADLLSHTGQQAHTLAVSVSKLWTSFGDGGATEVLEAANNSSRGVRAHWVTLRTLLNSTLELTDAELLRLRSGYPVARLVGAPERAAVAFSPVVIDRQVYGVVEVSQAALRRSELILRHAERTLTTAAALLLVSWLWASLLGMRWVGAPVHALAAKAIRIGKGDFDGPLQLATGDEFGLLADTLNEACTELAASRAAIERETQARIDAINQVRRADRLIAVGRIAAGVAHELGTPIQVVSERAKMARQGEVEPEDLPRTLDIIIEQTARIAATIRQVLDLARQQPPNRSLVSLRHLIDSTRELLAPLAAKKSIDIRIDVPESAEAFLDANQIRQVLMNLVMNAIQAMDHSGSIWIRADARPMPTQAQGTSKTAAERAWAIAVSDTGAGISEENLARIFEPFFTTKGSGEGTGLGLSIVYGIVQEHGGAIEVDSRLGRGSTFTVLLPTEAAARA
jgi:two-component system NtrC family sensor kinase